MVETHHIVNLPDHSLGYLQDPVHFSLFSSILLTLLVGFITYRIIPLLSSLFLEAKLTGKDLLKAQDRIL